MPIPKYCELKNCCKSQMTEEQALQLNEEIKEEWWQKNQARFLEKIK